MDFMLRLRMPLIDVHDLPAAIRSTSRSSSSGVQRILGITQSISRFQRTHCLKNWREPNHKSPASANIEFGCSGTYQITVGIKHFQKARLIGSGVWLNSPQCIFAYKERSFYSAIVSPKSYGTPCLVVRSTVVRKINHEIDHMVAGPRPFF